MTCCRGCIVKTDAFISALLSVAVLAFSTFVLISSVLTHPEWSDTRNDTVHISSALLKFNIDPSQHNSTNQSSSSPFLDTWNANATDNKERSRNVSTESTTILSIDLSVSPTGRDGENDDDVVTEPTSTTTQSKPTAWNVFSHHDFWKGKSDTYIMLMQVSSGAGIFAAVLQLGFSWLLICGSTKDLKDRTKLWNLSNFIVLILLVVIILVPLSYNNGTNQFKGASTFWRQIQRRIKSIPDQFSLETLNTIGNSISNFLVTDITLYYYILGVDALVLMSFLIISFLCCILYPCRKCCCKKKQGRTDSDLMLFGNSGETY